MKKQNIIKKSMLLMLAVLVALTAVFAVMPTHVHAQSYTNEGNYTIIIDKPMQLAVSPDNKIPISDFETALEVDIVSVDNLFVYVNFYDADYNRISIMSYYHGTGFSEELSSEASFTFINDTVQLSPYYYAPSVLIISDAVKYVNYYYDIAVNGGEIQGEFTSPYVSVFDVYTVVEYNAYNSGYDVGRADGFADGFADGRVDGYNDGEEAGWSGGEDLGYGIGYDAGYSDGVSELDGYGIGYDTGYSEGFISGVASVEGLDPELEPEPVEETPGIFDDVKGLFATASTGAIILLIVGVLVVRKLIK